MANSRQDFFALLSEQHNLLVSDFDGLAQRIRALLLSNDDVEGVIQPDRWRILEQEVGLLILAYFLSLASNRAFTLSAEGALTPQTPFMRRLWAGVETASEMAVEQQARILRAGLNSAPDLAQRLERARGTPFSERREAFYETVLSGRTLADRVLAAGAETRRKVNLLLREQLASRRPARAIALTLQQFLTGKLKVNNQPYGTTALFDAERLQHGEITRAYGQTGLAAAALNPFVISVDWVVSARHREIDLCDANAAGSPYLVEDVPFYPGHGNCLCFLRYRVDGRTRAVIEQMRGSELLNVRGALSPGFAEFLLRSSGVNG